MNSLASVAVRRNPRIPFCARPAVTPYARIPACAWHRTSTVILSSSTYVHLVTSLPFAADERKETEIELPKARAISSHAFFIFQASSPSLWDCHQGKDHADGVHLKKTVSSASSQSQFRVQHPVDHRSGSRSSLLLKNSDPFKDHAGPSADDRQSSSSRTLSSCRTSEQIASSEQNLSSNRIRSLTATPATDSSSVFD